MAEITRWFRNAAAPFSVVGGVGVFVYSTILLFNSAPSRWLRPALVVASAAAVFTVGFGIQLYLYQRLRRRAARETSSLQNQVRELKTKLEATDMLLSHEIEDSGARLRDNEARYFSIHEELEAILALDYAYCIFLRQKAGSESYEEIRKEFYKYSSEVLSHIARLFGRYTGFTCAASIKVFSASKAAKREIDHDKRSPRSPSYVFTLARDPASHYERGRAYQSGNEIYSYTENSAFFDIIHVSERDGYYFGNDLHGQPVGIYRNSNPKWKDFYDSVAVSSLKNPTSRAIKQSIGFLCVDNKGGGFDDRSCRVLLDCCASIVYYSSRLTISLLEGKGLNP